MEGQKFDEEFLESFFLAATSTLSLVPTELRLNKRLWTRSEAREKRSIEM